MLRAFFENAQPSRRHLFDGLAVSRNPAVMERQGRYPVIYLTFKDVKANDLEGNLKTIKSLIAEEYSRHSAIFESLNKREQERFDAIESRTAEQDDFEQSLRRLSQYLHRHSGQRVIVLIDEYDAPLHAAQEYGYTKELVPFIRGLLSGLLKDNDAHLEKAILTGILRVAKESIFSGLNNLIVYSVSSERFADKFGLTVPEVEAALEIYGQTDKREEVKTWYNGYRIGGHEIHNPWSVLHFLQDSQIKPYWINTSDNALIRDLIRENGDKNMEIDLGRLLTGESITCEIHENITFRDLPSDRDVLWSFLYFTGYLTLKAEKQDTSGRYSLCIPNQEIRSFFKGLFTLESRVPDARSHTLSLREALRSMDMDQFQQSLQDLTATVLSYHDLAGDAERVYHAFMLGLLLLFEDDFLVTSNRESGFGRYDIMLEPRSPALPGMILEVKQIKDQAPEPILDAAIEQIQQRDYARQLRDKGINPIYTLAVVFQNKKVWIETRELIANAPNVDKEANSDR